MLGEDELIKSQPLSLRNQGGHPFSFPRAHPFAKGCIERTLSKIIPYNLLYHTHATADAILRLPQIGFASGKADKIDRIVMLLAKGCY